MLRAEITRLAYMMRSGHSNSGGSVQMRCPNAAFSRAHKGKDYHFSFGIKVSAGRSVCNCFTCHVRGDVTYVFNRVHQEGGIPDDVLDYIKTAEKGDLATTVHRLRVTRESGFIPKREKERKCTIDKQVLKYQAARSAVEKYLEERGVADYEMDRYQIGLDIEDYRLTFPITMRRAGVVGCVGRALKEGPKYYKYDGFRNDVLLGEQFLDVTLQEVVLVEGPFDLIRASRVLPNVLALNGLTLTDVQRERLLHFADEITFLFDADPAGEEAIERLGKYLCRRCRVFVAQLPEGKDPDDMDEEELYRIFDEERMIFHA